MIAYILRRFGSIFVIMFLASIIIFAITQFLPGDVAQLVLGQFATEEAIANLREEYGLNNPFYVQYLDWAVNFVKGDWGDSLVNRMPIFPIVMSRLRNSAMLALVVLMIYVPLGILLGVLAALKRDKLPDQMITTVSMVFVALPVFVSSLLLIPLFCHYLGWLPANSSIHPDSSFGEALPFLILPAIAVALNSIGYVARMTRAGTIDVLRTDYVRAAYLKGLPRRQVLFRHVLRNALLPTVTIVAMDAGMMIGGMLVAEVVFGYPGLGRLLLYAMQNQDLPLIQACSMVAVTMLCLANLVADLLYGFLNPRIRVK
ncbi:MAG: ABC transporter permease [Thermacetogeniaceae bacterium]|jgi:peptide/nickel transport system permease protein